MSSEEVGSLAPSTTGTEHVPLAVRVDELSKCYHIYQRPGDRLWQFVLPRLSRLTGGRARSFYREFWALRDVSFRIGKGEAVGIVGRNGSGKSTLLQMICGTLGPSAGKVSVTGRVAALLELGSGFNPEFSGRDNVYLNAAIIGLSREEIDARFDRILEFADIGPFIDQPVKTYSSGMTVRLAFAVAINTDPDLLIVDEALAVGDELFQRKCFSRIEALRASGVTILFVSHAGGTVIELCDRALLLDGGELLMDGDPRSVVGAYHKLLYSPPDKAAQIRSSLQSEVTTAASGPVEIDGDQSTQGTSTEETFDPDFVSSNVLVYESHGAHISNASILSIDGRQVNGLVRGRQYVYRYRVTFDRPFTGVRFGMLIKSVTGLHLGGSLSSGSLQEGEIVLGGQVAEVEFRFWCHLNPGVYFLNSGVFGCVGETETLLHRLADVAVFRVLPAEDTRPQEMIDFGCVAQVNLNV